MHRHFLRSLLFTLFFILILQSASFGQQGGPRPVTLRIFPPNDNPIPQAEDILRNNYERELTSHGYTLTPDKSQSVLTVSIRYRTLGRMMYYDVSVAETETGEPVASRSFEVGITARLGTDITVHISFLLDDLESWFTGAPAITRRTGPDTQTSQPDADGDTAASGGDETGGGETPAAADAVTADDAATGQADTAAGAGQKNGFASRLTGSVDAGLFIPVGDIGSYASFGYEATAFLGYSIPNSDVGIAPGLCVGFVSFTATGLAEETDVILVPFGAGLRISSSLEPQFTPVLYLQGGGALMMYETESSGSQQKVIPFFSSGLGLNARIFKSAGLEFRLDFNIFLESGITILGISPILGVSL